MAEGLETESELAAVTAQGMHAVQGVRPGPSLSGPAEVGALAGRRRGRLALKPGPVGRFSSSGAGCFQLDLGKP